MPKLHPTPQEGWAVHVYDRDRHLLFTLDPSHGWMLLLGGVLGFTIAVAGYLPPATAPDVSLPSPAVAPLQLD
ncbi:hypothetical protein [Leptolyngbya sp. KIOST-1]|uniref:hypothetical protein n=1 Tax=Leptolyngbya sp. KIOST-1 TaxID=1229172 RepID=UPI000907C09B|nr:hypothetical protein [Leptolyngbya sp. KIOST-1]